MKQKEDMCPETIDWCSDPNADNDEYLEPWMDEGFESEPDEEEVEE